MILWGLSAVAGDWERAETLTALCTAAEDVIVEVPFHWVSAVFAWRVLWPLRWFGLLEMPGPVEIFDVAWRKSALFDRFLSLDVGVQDNRGTGHLGRQVKGRPWMRWMASRYAPLAASRSGRTPSNSS